ncbi:MAG: hypothetical protein AAB602_02540 [Patescibacteria group bacterium]|mgnify:CR=1 FL=1
MLISSLPANVDLDKKLDTTDSLSRIKILTRCLAPIAVFFLIFRTGTSIKVFDLLAAIIGVFLAVDGEARLLFRNVWQHFRPYVYYFLALVALIAVAQALMYAGPGTSVISAETAVNFARVIFNSYVFFLAAFLICYDKKLLMLVCAAIFISPAVVLPAYWDLSPDAYISGGRLTGFLQTPILFGFWMAIVFIVGIGLMLAARTQWLKIITAAWLIIIANFIMWAGSRASWIALALALILCFIFYIQRRKWFKIKQLVVICIVAGLGGYLLIPNDGLKMKPFIADRAANLAISVVTLSPSAIQAQSHSYGWPVFLKSIFKTPQGVGFGYPISSKIGTNNSFLEVALYGGIGASIIFFAILANLFGAVIRAIRNLCDSSMFDVKVAWLLVSVIVAVDIFFTNAFLWRHAWFAFGMVFGISLAEQRGVDDLSLLAKKSEDKSRSL